MVLERGLWGGLIGVLWGGLVDGFWGGLVDGLWDGLIDGLIGGLEGGFWGGLIVGLMKPDSAVCVLLVKAGFDACKWVCRWVWNVYVNGFETRM